MRASGGLNRSQNEHNTCAVGRGSSERVQEVMRVRRHKANNACIPVVLPVVIDKLITSVVRVGGTQG